jgi:NAD(P)-dependent dehydrogenase (short-subunit alcohol dehydrogenase family)
MINNAGVADLAPLHETSIESWNRVIAVTLTGTFLGMKYAIPIMRRVRAERPCARVAAICRILQGHGDEVSNTY